MAKFVFICLVALLFCGFSMINGQECGCSANHTYAQTVSGCPRSCTNLKGPVCQSILLKPGCYCSPGYVLKLSGSDKCIEPEDC